MTSQTVNDEEKNYKKKIIENLNDEGKKKIRMEKRKYLKLWRMGKEIIETLNYEKKWRIMGPITSFSKERLASQPCLASNELSEASLHCLLQ